MILDLPPDTLPELCTEDGEFLPHPSSCHWYFRYVIDNKNGKKWTSMNQSLNLSL